MSIISGTKKWIDLEGERNGRNKLAVCIDMIYNYVVYGVFPQEYYHFGFYKKSSRDKKSYFTTKMYIDRRKKLSKPAYEKVVFLDKYIFSKVFNEYYGRECMLINENTEKREIVDFMTKSKKAVYKPLDACEGQGIRSYSVENYKSPEELADDLLRAHKGNALLDAWIVQSEEMNKFYDKGVNCVRIYTFLHNGHFEFIDAKVSFGTKSDIVNATLDGNLFATVDVNTGIITSDLTDYTLVLHKKHPITGFVAKGTHLPCWDEMLDLAKKAAYCVPQVAYVGWDIALTTSGPVLIEGNHCGGCGGNQFCTLSDKTTGQRERWDVINRIETEKENYAII